MTGRTPDRLEWLLKHFELRARVFQAGVLCESGTYEPDERIGYIHFLQHGAVRVTDEGKAPVVIDQPGVFFYLNATRTHMAPVHADTSIVCASFEFGLGSGNPLQAALPSMHYTSFAAAPSLERIVQQMVFETVEHHCGRQSILDRLCEIALVLVLRDLMDSEGLSIGILAGFADAKLQKAIVAMHAQPGHSWTLADLAQTAGMSRARFAAHFREVVGVTPGAYLTDWRIGLAKSMLVEGKSISVIAQAVGYGSASALSRAFQGACDVSPREWVRRLENR